MIPYEFMTLRYRHDAMTGEFAIIGVVVKSGQDFLGARFNPRIRRLKEFFGTMSHSHHRSLMKFLARRFDQLAETEPAELLGQQRDLQELAFSILPQDDSAYQWSPVLKGLTNDPAAELNELYSRLVVKCEQESSQQRRDDGAVWRSFSTEFRKHGVLEHLEEKELSTEDFSYKFDHTWKNGVWNIYEPLAFDFAEPESITEKGSRWLGRGVGLSDAEPHKFWFLVGEPEGDRARRTTEKALNLLHKIPGGIEVVREHERESFALNLAGQIREHDATQP